jgi:hypothetical protein
MNKLMKLPMNKFLMSIPPEYLEFIEIHVNIRDSQTHSHLQFNLIKHMCQLHGQS